MNNRLAFIALALFIGMTLWFNAPAPDLPDGSVAVPTKTSFNLLRRKQQVDATVIVKDSAGDELGRWYIDNGQLYEPPRAGDGQRATLSLQRERYLIDAGLDIGTWAGVGVNVNTRERVHAGLRISPLRLFYGTTSTDLVVGQHVAGAGFSVYPPSDRTYRWWRHWGLGGWYVFDYNGEASGWAVGAAFSTRN